jgi:potassium efflux system protein
MRFIPILLLLGTLFAALSVPAVAQLADGSAETPALLLERWDAEATLIELRLAEDAPGSGEIEGMRAALEAQRAQIGELHAQALTSLAPLRKQFDALGEAPDDIEGESAVITENRVRLKARIAEADARFRRSDRADARAVALLAQLAEHRRKHFTREMLNRGPGLFEDGVVGRGLSSIGRLALEIRAETRELIAGQSIDVPYLFRVLILVALTGMILYLTLLAKRIALQRLFGPAKIGEPQQRRALVSIMVALIRILMPAIALVLVMTAIWNIGLHGPQGEILLRGIGRTLMIMVGAYALGGAFYAPRFPQLRLSSLPEAEAISAHRWLIALAAIVGLDRVLIVHGQSLGLSIEGLELLNTVLLMLGSVTIWFYSSFITRTALDLPPDPASTDEEGPSSAEEPVGTRLGPLLIVGARLLARFVAVVAPALAVMGYFVASRFVFYPVVFSGAVIGFCVLLFYLVQDTVDRIVEPVGAGEDTGEERQSRIRLVPVAVAFLLICAALPVLALIWGADTTDLSAAWRMVSKGFSIGDVVISPLDFFSFLLVFSIGYVLTRVIQGVINRSVLPATRLDSGGKALVSAGIGYAGILLSALVAISTTGLDLSNLAIVAGALSVGIGFGLQNIVNNFVSGLILLIERPIKAGDWVELTSGMGYVTQINVRSTEIQTFDRAALIVPNSELISGPVTNWTHTNLNGRLKVPVGVAYGTDPKRVETILTEIAQAHPMLLRRPAPYVLFLRFGGDALEFEIRGVLRDVNWILNVTSDINFEISRRFAEEGIEIPFAQRDLHLKNAGELGHSIGSAIRGVQGQGDRESGGDAPKPTPSPTPPSRRPPGPTEGAGNEPDGDT